MRLVFAGTPEVAVPSLEALAVSRHRVVGVVTRPPARAGRGRGLVASPVAAWAEAQGVPALTPTSAGDPQFLAELTELAPDCCPVVAYGALLPQSALDVPRHGWVNLHFSLLPAWRGAAPVQHAVIAGDEVTGATTFQIVRELDAGPTYGMLTESVRPHDTAGDLLERLSSYGAELLIATLDGIEDGTVEARPQPSEGVSLAPKLTTADGRLDWSRTAMAIDRRIRGCTPAPGAWTEWKGQRLKVLPVRLAADQAQLPAGAVRLDKDAVYVGTGDVPVRLGDVQPPGKAPMPATAWARGLRPPPDRLGS